MSAGVAPGDIIIAMGSPGTILSSTNTIVATPLRVTAAMKRRWAAEFMIHARRDRPPLPLLRERAGVRGVGITTALIRRLRRSLLPQGREKGAQALATNRGSSAPVALGVTFRL